MQKSSGKDSSQRELPQQKSQKDPCAEAARTETETESKRRGRTPVLANLGTEREATGGCPTRGQPSPMQLPSLILATTQKVAAWQAFISRWGNPFKARLSLSTWWGVINSLALFITSSDWQPTDPAPRITWKLFSKIRLKQ